MEKTRETVERYRKMDFADDLYVWARNTRGVRLSDEVYELPYLVIGEYAYVLGYNGNLYMFPYLRRARYSSNDSGAVYNRPRWMEGVEIDENGLLGLHPEFADNCGFPIQRLKNVLADQQNITDIMRQSGISVMTV